MNKMFSIKEIIETQVREAFTEQMNTVVSQITAEAQAKLDAKVIEIKQQTKKMANEMTLELLQKMNVSGISVEFKL